MKQSAEAKVTKHSWLPQSTCTKWGLNVESYQGNRAENGKYRRTKLPVSGDEKIEISLGDCGLVQANGRLRNQCWIGPSRRVWIKCDGTSSSSFELNLKLINRTSRPIQEAKTLSWRRLVQAEKTWNEIQICLNGILGFYFILRLLGKWSHEATVWNLLKLWECWSLCLSLSYKKEDWQSSNSPKNSQTLRYHLFPLHIRAEKSKNGWTPSAATPDQNVSFSCWLGWVTSFNSTFLKEADSPRSLDVSGRSASDPAPVWNRLRSSMVMSNLRNWTSIWKSYRIERLCS